MENPLRLPSVLMVRSCPAGQTADHRRNRIRCETPADRNAPLVYQLPVYDRQSTVIYKNLYCAQCHLVAIADTIPFGWWRYQSCQSVRVQHQIGDFLQPAADMAACVLPTSHHRPKPFLRPCYQHLSWVRKCYPRIRVVDGCVTNSSGNSSGNRRMSTAAAELRRQCALFDDPVMGYTRDDMKTIVWYKNRHCAACNGDNGDSDPTNLTLPSISLQCTPPISRFNPDEGTSIIDLIVSDNCPDGEYIDPLTLECRAILDGCRPGFQLVNGTCRRNLYDSHVYSPPQLRPASRGVLAVNITLTLTSEFVTVVATNGGHNFTKNLHIGLSTVFRQWVHQGLFTEMFAGRSGNPRIKNVTVSTVQTSTSELLGGVECRIENGTEIHGQILVHYRIHDDAEYFEILKNFRSLKSPHGIRFGLITKNIVLPPVCRRGKLVSMVIDESMWELLTTRVRNKKTEMPKREFVNLVIHYDSTTNTSYVHTCDTIPPKFTRCPLLNYLLTDFVRRGSNLVHNITGVVFTSGQYVISGGQVFVCVTSRSTVFSDAGLYYVNLIGFIVSEIFLAYTLVTYLLLAPLRTVPGQMVMHLSATLLLAQLVFMLGMSVQDEVACTLSAAVQHYLWLSTFAWMNAIAVNTCKTFAPGMATAPRGSRKILAAYCAYAYGLPLAVVGACAAVHVADTPVYGSAKGVCWISHGQALLYGFIAPFTLMVLANAVLFIVAAVNIRRIKNDTVFAKEGASTTRWDVVVYAKMSALMGFSWLFGIVGAFWNETAVFYLFTIFNSLTGFFIGLAFACTSRVRKQYRKRFTSECKRQVSVFATSSTGTMTSHGSTSTVATSPTADHDRPETKF